MTRRFPRFEFPDFNDRDAVIRFQLDRLDHWEAAHNKRIELTMKDRITVDSNGVATVTYTVDEYEELYKLTNLAMKIRLLWESCYSRDHSLELLYTFEYVGVVIDYRLGLRKTLRSSNSQSIPKLARAVIRDQVDGIIAALDDIETLTQ
jgi:hypothetical protein